MEWCHVHKSNDFMVPTGKDGVEVIPSSTEYWFQLSEFENGGFARRNLENMNSDKRGPHVNESRVPQVHQGEGSSSSSIVEDDLLVDCSMRTSDDLFNDLLDLENQNSLQNMDEVFQYRDSFHSEDPMHLENPYESIYIQDSMHLPWNWRISEPKVSDNLMKDLSGREDAVSEDHNLEAPYTVDTCPISESFITTMVNEPVCTEATVLQELEDVMLQLNSKTRLCIRDALYRLANSTTKQNVNFRQRQELSRSLEQKTNEIDAVIASLMFNRPDIDFPSFQSSHPILKNHEIEASCGSWSNNIY